MNLRDTCLAHANLANAQLAKAHLYGVDLTAAHLAGANLAEAALHGANLTDAVLYDADLSGAFLNAVNLTRVDLTRANLTRADLTQTNLTDADITDAHLVNIYSFDDTDITGATWSEQTQWPPKYSATIREHSNPIATEECESINSACRTARNVAGFGIPQYPVHDVPTKLSGARAAAEQRATATLQDAVTFAGLPPPSRGRRRQA